MNSGLFQAVRGSGLFSVDPDIGVGECRSSFEYIHSNKFRDRQSRGTIEILQASIVHNPCDYRRRP